MKLKNLTKYGIPEIIIDAWIRRQGDYLLPLQEMAIHEGLLPTGENEVEKNEYISQYW